MPALRIVPPPKFRHAGSIPGFSSKDPRDPDFAPDRVQIDLRSCEFIWPPAVAWCAVYGLLVSSRGIPCELLVPENRGVATYLKSTDLFALLQENDVDVDDRGLGNPSSDQTILHLVRFSTEFEAEAAANTAIERLGEMGRGAANLYPIISENFAELAFNAVQHAESPFGGLGLIQYFSYPDAPRFALVVADGGIGIRAGLSKNPALAERALYDWTAIELAARERISGTGDATRGIGLFGVAEDARTGSRQLVVHSGIGVLEISEDVRQDSRRTNLFPGTLGAMIVST